MHHRVQVRAPLPDSEGCKLNYEATRERESRITFIAWWSKLPIFQGKFKLKRSPLPPPRLPRPFPTTPIGNALVPRPRSPRRLSPLAFEFPESCPPVVAPHEASSSPFPRSHKKKNRHCGNITLQSALIRTTLMKLNLNYGINAHTGYYSF